MPNELVRLELALAERYTLRHELGRGGMGTVYLADDLKHERRVAIKVLPPELAAVLGPDRFLREVKIVAQLTHPHILPLHDSGEAGGFLYYVMPYVEGESLRDRLTREKQLPVAEALQISHEVADALSYAHSHGVIHRDIKPENILLQSGHALVADFGIARAIDQMAGDRLTETGAAIGTPAYMSPEQAAGSAMDHRSDLYALGCVLYEMLAGEPPFTGPTAASVMHQHAVTDPPDVTLIRPTVPSAVADVVRRCLAKAPADRFTGAAHLAEALTSRDTGARPGEPLAHRRRRWARRVGALAAVAVAVGAGVVAWRASRDRAPPPAPTFRPFTIVSVFGGTADAEMREVVHRLVITALDQSSILQTLPAGQIRLGLASAGKPDTTPVDLATAHELALRGRLASVVTGSVDRVGEAYAITVRVLDADTGTVLASEQVSTRSDVEVIGSVDRAVRTVLRRLGERRDVQDEAPGLRWIATPSLPAYKKYLEAGRLRLVAEQRWPTLRDVFLEALALDPDFAYVWGFLGNTYLNLGLRDSARWAWQEALRRPDRLSEHQRTYFEGIVAWERGDLEAFADALSRVYPHIGGANDLGIALSAIDRPDSAVAVMEQWERSRPFGLSSLELNNLTYWLTELGRHDDARARARQMTGLGADLRRSGVEAAAGSWAAAESLATRVLRDRQQPEGNRRDALGYLASARAARGAVANALRHLDDVRTSAAAQAQPEATRAAYLHALTLRVASGSPVGRMLPAGLVADTAPAGRLLAALWAAVAGDTGAARAYLSQSAVGTDQRHRALQDGARLVESALAGAVGNWLETVHLAKPVANRRIADGLDVDGLAAWITAEAYTRLDAPDSAATHFELISSRWRRRPGGSSLRGLTDSFARQRLVVLYARLGRIGDARAEWVQFSEAFSEPDPGFAHLLEEARRALEAAERIAR